MSTGTVAVVDGRREGHHTSYLRLVSRMLLDLGARVLLLCPEPREVTAWLEEHAGGDLSGRVDAAPFRLVEAPRPPRHRLAGLARYLDRWRAVDRAIRNLRRVGAPAPRCVLFLWLDDYLSSARYISLASPFLLPLVFRHPWAGVFFRPVHLRPAPEGSGRPRRHPYSALRLAFCRRVFLHDESKLAALGPAAVKARRLPDFTDESPPDEDFPLIGELRARARGRTVVSALGSMSRRKGILTLLEVARSAGDEPWFFVFAGELVDRHFSPEEAAELRALAERPPANALFYFRRIPGEASFNALVAASDVVFAAYRDFRHSSNILTKAALFEKPVIVSRGHLIAERVRRFNLGCRIAQDSAEECAAALRLLGDPSRFRQEIGVPRFEDYVRFNSQAGFSAELAELLAELG